MHLNLNFSHKFGINFLHESHDSYICILSPKKKSQCGILCQFLIQLGSKVNQICYKLHYKMVFVRSGHLKRRWSKWWKILNKWWKIKSRLNSSYNTFKWIIGCHTLQILLRMDIVEKITLEMIMQMRISYMMNFVIHWTFFNLLKIIFIINMLTSLFSILCIEVHYWLAWLKIDYL